MRECKLAMDCWMQGARVPPSFVFRASTAAEHDYR